MRSLLLLSTGAVVLGLAVVACGSSGTTSAPRPVPGGAAARAADSAPTYCRALTGSGALVEVGKAMNELAANPHDGSAKAAMRRAATSLRQASRQAPHPQQAALASAAAAIDGLAETVPGRAARAERALVRAGHLVEHSCRFPVG
jgi:hypothetical protein